MDVNYNGSRGRPIQHRVNDRSLQRQAQAQANYSQGRVSPFTQAFQSSVPAFQLPFPSASIAATVQGKAPVWPRESAAAAPWARGFAARAPSVRKRAYHAAHLCSSNFQTFAARLTELIGADNIIGAASLVQDCMNARYQDLQNPGTPSHVQQSHMPVIELLDKLSDAFSLVTLEPGTLIRYFDRPMRFVLKDRFGNFLTVTQNNIVDGSTYGDYFTDSTPRENYPGEENASYGGKRTRRHRHGKKRSQKKTRARNQKRT